MVKEDTVRDVGKLYGLIRENNARAEERVRWFLSERDTLRNSISDNHGEVVDKLDEVIKHQKITNGRVTALEVWMNNLKGKIEGSSGTIMMITTVVGWVIIALINYFS